MLQLPAQFEVAQAAAGTAAFAGRVGAHAARAAEVELLRGVDGLAGLLPRELGEQRQAVGDHLLAREAVAPLAEVLVAAADVVGAPARDEAEAGAVGTAAAPVVEQVAVEGDAAVVDRVAGGGGAAELVVEGGIKHRYNTSILVDQTGRIIGKYRKVHLPGWSEPLPNRAFQHLEKRYFEPGDLGFPVWRTMGGIMGMCICNDRRWPETYRVLGLQGVEMVLLGYNSPVGLGDPYELDALEPFHNHLVMQSGAYQNATWVIGVAKAGFEEGFNMIGQTCIIAPSGEIVAMCCTMGDELVVRKCDLDMAIPYRADIFNFAAHRRPEHYKLITDRAGALLPLISD